MRSTRIFLTAGPMAQTIGLLTCAAIAATQDSADGNDADARCDDNTHAAAIANGGTFSFNCGPTLHSILPDKVNEGDLQHDNRQVDKIDQR